MADTPQGSVLYRWPTAARFGRVVPKTKFYEHASLGPAVKDLERIDPDASRRPEREEARGAGPG